MSIKQKALDLNQAKIEENAVKQMVQLLRRLEQQQEKIVETQKYIDEIEANPAAHKNMNFDCY